MAEILKSKPKPEAEKQPKETKSTPESRRRYVALISLQNLDKSIKKLEKTPSKIGKPDPKLEKRTFTLGGKILDTQIQHINNNAKKALSALQQRLDNRLVFAELDADTQGTTLLFGGVKLTDRIIPGVFSVSDIPTGYQGIRAGMFVLLEKDNPDKRLGIAVDPETKSIQAKLQYNIQNKVNIGLELDPTRRSMIVRGSFKLKGGTHGMVGASAGTSGSDYEGGKSQNYNLNILYNIGVFGVSGQANINNGVLSYSVMVNLNLSRF